MKVLRSTPTIHIHALWVDQLERNQNMGVVTHIDSIRSNWLNIEKNYGFALKMITQDSEEGVHSVFSIRGYLVFMHLKPGEREGKMLLFSREALSDMETCEALLQELFQNGFAGSLAGYFNYFGESCQSSLRFEFTLMLKDQEVNQAG